MSKPEKDPNLHALHVKWACVHLSEFNKMIGRMREFANVNTEELAFGMVDLRTDLIKKNSTYRDAWEILECIRLGMTYVPVPEGPIDAPPPPPPLLLYVCAHTNCGEMVYEAGGLCEKHNWVNDPVDAPLRACCNFGDCTESVTDGSDYCADHAARD